MIRSALAATSRTPAALAAVAIAALCLYAGGCGSHGEYTRDGVDAAKLKMATLKSGVHYQMAHQQFMAGDLEKARRTIETSLNVVPNYAPSHVLKGRIYLESGELETARQSLLVAESIDKANVDAQYYLGVSYERFGQYEPALLRYTAAADLDRANPQYTVAASEMLVSLGRPEEAKAMLLAARSDYAHNAAIAQSLGQLCTLRGESQEAVTHFANARSLAPEDLVVLEQLARAQANVGQYAEAEANLSRLLLTDVPRQSSAEPSYAKVRDKEPARAPRRDLQALRARCLVGMDRLAEARQILVELATDPAGSRDLYTWTQLGHVAARLDDTVRLRQAAARLIAMAPQRHEGHTFRAIAQRNSGEFAAALNTADQAISLAGTDVSPLLVKASIQLKQQQLAFAQQTAERVLVIDPANATALRIVNAQALSAVEVPVGN